MKKNDRIEKNEFNIIISASVSMSLDTSQCAVKVHYKQLTMKQHSLQGQKANQIKKVIILNIVFFFFFFFFFFCALMSYP